MNDLLRMLLVAADDVGRVFDHATTTLWPMGALARLRVMGILRQSAAGLYAPCPNCSERHVEPVIVRPRADGTRRFYISCRDALRIAVAPAMCECWEIDPSGLAGATARALGLTATPQTVVTGRLWRLGRMPWPPGSSQTREVLLAVRLHDLDGSAVAAHVGPSGRAIVLVPHHVPDDRLWPGRVPPVVAMSQVTTVDGDHLVVDPMALCEVVAEADRRSSEQAGLSLDAISAKKVRRHVNEVIESKITNEALVQAYRIHGSYRKAADALNADGYVTDRWAVERAVKAAGGPKAVKKKDDSASVARTVASQSRDRGKKILQYR
ncbi:MAG: hypothetical protein IT448_05340 [Phycisphaerales bacterium]|nr:hypothetical protein [Phycisphaerales bacterium]